MDMNRPVEKDPNIKEGRDVIFSRLMDYKRNGVVLLDIVTHESIKEAEYSVYMGKQLIEMNKDELMCCLQEVCQSYEKERRDRS